MFRGVPAVKQLYLSAVCTILAWCFAGSATAQLCNGSLGDPVVNITFGDGTSGNTGGYTPTNGYTYTSSQCPNDGFYTITRSSSGCFSGSWHTVTTDHTGNGAFMLVNASYAPGDFFLTNVTDLCPNTTYEFAAWLLNILNRSGIKPNITFSIETTGGAVLKQFSTGDIPETASPTWKQYGIFFTTPANNPAIVLRMTNNAPGGSGNDIALDDITFRPCSSVLITSAIQGNSTDTVNICDDVTTTYTLKGSVSAGYVAPVYNWQLSTDLGTTWKDIAGASALTYQRTPTPAGTYWYRLSVTEKSSAGIPACRIASNYVVINVHAQPVVNVGGKRVMIAGHGIVLNGTVTGDNLIYYWDPPEYLSDINITTPVATPVADKKYTLYAISPYGCSSQDTASIKVIAGIFVPNAFTPNNDGKNDSWRIPYLDPLLGAEVNVFNRYGQLVYHAEGTAVDWDGTYKGAPQSPGTYVFSVHFKNDYPDIKGTLLLIR
jgi:gliding motility-associated-like protein